MKFLFVAIALLLFPATLCSQEISILPADDHSGNNLNTFPTYSGTISVSGDMVSFGQTELANPVSWAISPGKNRIGALQLEPELTLLTYDDRGAQLGVKELEFYNPGDESIRVYTFDDGRTAIRDNIANFTFFDPGGEQLYSVSNSSQSTDGESISELVSDRYGRTIVLYNPAIAYGSQRGSRARLLPDPEANVVFFDSRDRVMKYISVENSGGYILLIATKENEDDRVLIFDRFGNELFRLDHEEDLNGATLSGEAGYVTVFSGGRMQVYDLRTGERLGSASSSHPVLYAGYYPEEEMIVALAGSSNGSRINNPVVTAVHVTERKIASEEIPFSLGVMNLSDISMSHTNSEDFRISGVHRPLDVRIRF